MADIKTLVINAVNKLISKKTDSDVTETSTNPVASSGVKTYVDSSIETNLTTFKESLADVAKLGTFESLTDKPTTLSGYGITDAKISNGTITIGKNSLTPATSLDWSAITNKPTTLSGYGVTNYINLDKAVSSTTTSLNNSGYVTVHVNELYEAYLRWGGKNSSGDFSALDAALVPDLGANRFAFLSPSAVTIEYSRDGGTTWTDYGASDATKSRLFAVKDQAEIIIGGTDSGVTTDYQVRITINTANTAGKVYSQLRKFIIYISSRGATGSYCTLSAATHGDPDNFKVFQEKVPISGWPGYNVINQVITTYGNNDSQYQYLRFTFGISGLSTNTSLTNALTIQSIMAFGGAGWLTPSTMAKTGHLYAYDYNQNASFPQAVQANKFIKYSGTSSQFLKADGSVDSNTYAKTTSLATVATSGSYNDLSNKPEFKQTTIETETFTVTDASVIPSFTLTNVAAVVVFVNSVLARDGEEYGITGGTTLTFSSTLPVGTEITIYKFVTAGSVITTPTYSIDSVLSTTSTNAVQNKVITETINALQASIDSAYAKYVTELG